MGERQNMTADGELHGRPDGSKNADVDQRTQDKGGRARAIRIAVGTLLVVGLVFGPLILHFTQKRHNRLPFAVAQSFPEEQSMVPGEAFATTLIEVMDHELSSLTGWRPNDLFLWGPVLWADNNSNRQLGIIRALRESVRVLRDNLTKVSATEYDQNLIDADTKFRNDEYKFWFPSAEGRFTEGVEALRRYVAGLGGESPTSEPINRRNVELIRLFQAWTDLLGGAHATLYDEDVSIWKTDDHFYYAQGLAHVMVHLTAAVRREYEAELRERGTVLDLLARVQRSLERAATLKPVMVLDGSSDGLFANHRRNLDAYIVNARQLMYSIREELEK
jgi:hypothetical protein